MPKYRIHGLVLASELELPPLPPIDDNTHADITISLAAVSRDGIEKPLLKRALAQAAENKVWLNIPNIARFLIRDGTTIYVDPAPQSDTQSVRLYLLGSCIGAILHQRKLLVLHANAIKIDDSAILFAGISGAGKSTTAATFFKRGYEVLSDDVVALNSEGNIIGGFPQLKLWEDTLQHLELDSSTLNRIRLQVNKYSLPIPSYNTDSSLPIKAVYILSTANEQQPGEFTITALRGISKFNHLKMHTYRANFMEGMRLKPEHLKLCGQLAKNVHMATVIRPTARFNAPELVDAVLADLASLETS